MSDEPAAPHGWTSRYISAEDFTFTVLGRKGSRLIREGEQPGQGVTRDELHNNVLAIAQERVGFKLAPAEQTRLMSYQKELWSDLVGVASLADPVQSGDLEAMARRAVDALNERARPGTRFVLRDALYLEASY
jgi:single-stranded DNA-specific DHH superfamily exonuclease